MSISKKGENQECKNNHGRIVSHEQGILKVLNQKFQKRRKQFAQEKCNFWPAKGYGGQLEQLLEEYIIYRKRPVVVLVHFEAAFANVYWSLLQKSLALESFPAKIVQLLQQIYKEWES